MATGIAMNQRWARRETPPTQRAIQLGLSGGVMALLVCLIGLVNAFSKRFIINDVLTTAQAILAIIVLITGYMAAARTWKRGQPAATAIVYGALAGLMVGVVLAALVVIGSAVNLREVLVNATPALYEILTFEQESQGVGLAMLLLATGVLGLLGALLFILPDRMRNAVLMGFGVLIFVGLLQDLIELVLNRNRGVQRFFYTSNGLTVTGALLLFIVPFLLRLGWGYAGDRVRSNVEALPPASRRGLSWATAGLGILFLLLFPRIFGSFPSEVMNNVALLGVLMGLGLNIVVGFAGLLDLGYVGFFAIGAYTMAVLTSPQLNFPIDMGFWQALPFAILISIFCGMLLGIPVLKMRGDYLAIVTLGFGEIIRLLALSDLMRPRLGGAQGVTQISTANFAGTELTTPQTLYYLLLASVALTWFISRRLRDSRIGRAWMALREDEDVAEAMGINLVSTKLMAFGTGAAMAGLGGAIFAAKLQSIAPQSFDLLISINALAIIIIGGLASIPGVVVGALLLIGVPELLREFNEYRLWVYGIMMVVMMLFRPEGFWPEEHRRRELHDTEPGVEDSATVGMDPAAAPGQS